MKQRVHLITLGVVDQTKAAAFYDALSWERAESPDGVIASDLWGATLSLYPRAKLAEDLGRELPKGSGAMTLSCNVREKDEVAEVVKAAEAAGATIVKPPRDIFWGGHIAYFEDPEGFVWEVAHNPFSPLGANDVFQWNGA